MTNVVALRQAVADLRRLAPDPADVADLRQSLESLMAYASRV
jgi:hypothetical protein